MLDRNLREIGVLSVSEERTGCDTFNLTVENVHTFFFQFDNVNVLVHNTEPIKEGQIRPYRDFRKFTGDNLSGHEMRQNAHLRYTNQMHLKSGNPSLAVKKSTHDIISAEQRALGLHDPKNLKAQTPAQNISKNIRAMKNAKAKGAKITNEQIRNQARETIRHHRNTPCP